MLQKPELKKKKSAPSYTLGSCYGSVAKECNRNKCCWFFVAMEQISKCVSIVLMMPKWADPKQIHHFHLMSCKKTSKKITSKKLCNDQAPV